MSLGKGARGALAVVLGGVWIASGVRGEVERVQAITLKKGWNAVYLEVQPGDVSPAGVFAGVPIDIAASYFARSSPAQFVSDPGTNLFRELGWGVWYEESRPDAFLNTLHAIYGGQPYLLHATSDHVWTVRGTVVRDELIWQPDAFNFVGVPLEKQREPTFAQFFGGSKAHRGQAIYRLAGNHWRRVANPAAESMNAGEAFWVYCDGASQYPGPLGVETGSIAGLLVNGGKSRLVLRNHTDHPVTPTLEQIVPAGKTQPLSVVMEVVGDPAKPFRNVAIAKPGGNWVQVLPPVEAGKAVAVPFAPRLEEMTEYEQRSVLKIVSDLGTVHWVPVHSQREDLKE